MVRIQLDLPDEQVAELDERMAETKLRTRKDFFNNALTLFDWAIKQKKAGRVIAAIDESQDVVKELLMPALENVSVSPVQGEPLGTQTGLAKGA
jgi:metal-responsive CopG/Arc/MetJ family transcriptional regulator